MQLGHIPRVRLANLPTPLHEMPRLTKALKGPRLWIKRDDQTGLAIGGNKVRKAEFVIADALRKGADVIVTSGSTQSNHARTMSAAAARFGLKVVLVLRGREPSEYDGNLLLDYLMGAELRFHDVDRAEIPKIMEEVAEELRDKGRRPYIVPVGASYPVGALGYVNASLELLSQMNERGVKADYIVHAAGSGGTQAGLVLGNKALNTGVKVLSISIGPPRDRLTRAAVEVANGAAKLLGLNLSVRPEDMRVIDEYVGGGYREVGREVVEAIKLVARMEGIILDPVYTGKAMAGLIDLIRKGYFNRDENVVFIHTGGIPGIFPYRNILRP